MLFNSLDFVYFGTIVFLLYWLSYSQRQIQNVLLLIASYFFYGWMHKAFPIYLLGITLIGYVSGQLISGSKNERSKKATYIIALILATSCLAFLKYTNFVIETINNIFNNGATGISALHLLVPVGISFYTFTTIGYITDVYRDKIAVEKNFINYGAYVSFFPHLLSGPIPSASETLPQFAAPRKFSVVNLEEGASQIIWGLFKKMVIADNISLAANYCFANYSHNYGSTLFIGAILFGFQMYADFSGYSDIARGVAKLFAIDIFQNFHYPFFCKNIQDFWHRWHISLTKWFNEYIFTPIIVDKRNWGVWGVVFGLMATFTISGLWHGAGWTFVIWGALHGVGLSYEVLTKKWRGRLKKKTPPFLFNTITYILLFLFLIFTWIFFKADTIQDAFGYYKNMFSLKFFNKPPLFIYSNLIWVLLLLVVEWLFRKREYVLDFISKYRWIKFVLWAVIIFLIYLWHKKMNMQEYYYFKF